MEKSLIAIATKMMNGITRVDFRTVLNRDEAEQELSTLFPKESFSARDILDDLLKYHLLQNRGSRQIEFRHQLIQEYYAAEWLYEQMGTIDDLSLNQNYLNLYKWKEPLAITMELVKDNYIFTRRLLEQALKIDFLLGSKIAAKVDYQHQKEATQKIKDYITTENISEWLEVELLGKISSPTVKAYLSKFLNNSDIDLAERAALLIGDSKCEEAIDIASRNLYQIDEIYFSQNSWGGADKNGDIWIKRFKSLSFLAPKLAFDYLKEKMFDPGKQAFRILMIWHSSAETLMALDKDREVFNILVSRLEKPLPIDEGCNYLANMLDGAVGNEAEAVRIFNTIPNQLEDSVQARILSLIRDIDSSYLESKIIRLLPNAKAKLRDEIIKQISDRNLSDSSILKTFLTHANPEIVWASTLILAKLKNEAALPHLLDVLNSSPDPWKRQKASAALVHFKSKQVTPQLLHSLQHESEDMVRREVAFTLAQLGRQEAIPELRNSIANGPGLNPRIFGIRGMANLSELQPLWDLIKPRKEVCWQTAVVELLKLEQSDAKELIGDLIIDPGQESFSTILELITKYADKEIIKWLITALEFPAQYKSDKYFQNRVAFALNRCKPELLGCHLPQLKELHKRKNIPQLNWLIPATQSLCGFYSYTVYSDSKARPTEKLDNSSLAQATISKIGEAVDTIDKRTKRMAEDPKISVSNSNVNAPIGNQGNVISQVSTTPPDTSQKSMTEKEVNWGQRIAVIGLVIGILTLAATIFPQEINQKLRNWIQPQSTESIEQQSQPNEEPSPLND